MDRDRIASMFSLEGKTALIAGASRGIGEEIARVYALAGAKLIISSRRPEGINEAAERLRKDTGAEILAYRPTFLIRMIGKNWLMRPWVGPAGWIFC